MTKRIRLSSIWTWIKSNKVIASSIVATPAIIVLFSMLISQGSLVVDSYSSNEYCGGDVTCFLKLNQACFKEDVFLYLNKSEAKTMINADPSDIVTDSRLYRGWGKSYRQINLDEGCSGTWCGKPESDKRQFADYSIVFRAGQCYDLKIELDKPVYSKVSWTINPEGEFGELTADVYSGEVKVYDDKKIEGIKSELIKLDVTPILLFDNESIDSKVLGVYQNGSDIYLDIQVDKSYLMYFKENKTNKETIEYISYDDKRLVKFNNVDLSNELHIGSTSDVYIFNIVQWSPSAGQSKMYSDKLSANSTSTITSIKEGLVSYWKLNQNALDTMGLNNGTPRGVTNTTGWFDGAYAFDGIDDSINITYTHSLNITGEITISAWYKLAGNYSNIQVLYACAQADANNLKADLEFGRTDNKWGFWNDGVSQKITGTTSISNTNWNHVTLTRTVLNSTAWTLRLYHNGVLDATAVSSEVTVGAIVNCSIGKLGDYNSATTNRRFNGTIDNVMLFNRSLSASEVQGLYQATNDNQNNGTMSYSICIKDCIPQNDLIIAQYNLNNKSATGNISEDSKAGLYNLTNITGATFTTGYFDRGMYFNGVNQWVRQDSRLFQDNTGAVCSWFKRDIWHRNQYHIVWGQSNRTNASNTLVLHGFIDTSGYLALGESSMAGSEVYNSIRGETTLMNDTNWHHACWMSNGTQYFMYVDNVKQTIVVAGGANNGDWFADSPRTDTFAIGNSVRYSSVIPFNGTIDQVIIWNTTLTEQEMYRLYRSGYEQYINGSNTYLNNISWDGSANVTISSSNNNISGTTTPMCDTRTVVHYRLDNNANDCSNNQNGVIQAVTSTTGFFNNGYLYDNVGDIINISYSQAFNSTGDEGITASAWIYNIGATSSTQGVVSKWNTDTKRIWSLQTDAVDQSKITFFVSPDGNYGADYKAMSTTIVRGANVWQHVVGTWDKNGTIKIYVNGKLEDNRVLTITSLFDSNNMVSIGALRSAGEASSNQFNGTIDDVRIYNYSLNSKEVWELYNARFNATSTDYTKDSKLDLSSDFINLDLNCPTASCGYNWLNLTFSSGVTPEPPIPPVSGYSTNIKPGSVCNVSIRIMNTTLNDSSLYYFYFDTIRKTGNNKSQVAFISYPNATDYSTEKGVIKFTSTVLEMWYEVWNAWN